MLFYPTETSFEQFKQGGFLADEGSYSEQQLEATESPC